MRFLGGGLRPPSDSSPRGVPGRGPPPTTPRGGWSGGGHGGRGGEARGRGADTLITCGTLQSNGCRAVAAVAARLGLRAILALKGDKPASYDGNLLLSKLLGADV